MTTALERCRQGGLRRTDALVRLLTVLAEAAGPVSIRVLAEHPELLGACNQATLYRLLARLESIGVVRRLGLHERSAHFILVDGHGHHDYVICTECGQIAVLEMACPVHALEEEVARQTGFGGLYHELQFYGTCRRCQGARD